MSEQGQDQPGSPSADVVAMIEAALAALRRDPRRRGPWGQHGPWEAAPGHGPHGAWSPRGGWGPHGDPRTRGDARAPGGSSTHGGLSTHGGSSTNGGSPPHGGQPTQGDAHIHGGDNSAGEGSTRPGSPRGRDAAFGRMARFRMLEALEAADAAGQPLSVSTLAAAIGVDQPRASRLVQEGVERGHVRRVPDPSDARRALLELTAAGRAQLTEVRSHRRSAVEAALADFTPEEAQTFATLFARFARSWPHL
jgi:DNA-binding MarR family transcriptional regulator